MVARQPRSDGTPERKLAVLTARLFNKGGKDASQKLMFVDAPAVEGIPNCHLGYRGGVYSLGDKAISLAGNRVSRVLANSYRERLHSVEDAKTSVCLNGKTVRELERTFTNWAAPLENDPAPAAAG